MKINDLPKDVRQEVGFYALYGLCYEIISPTRPEMLAEAERILFTESIEIKQLAALLETTIKNLRSEVLQFLKAKGMDTRKFNRH